MAIKKQSKTPQKKQTNYLKWVGIVAFLGIWPIVIVLTAQYLGGDKVVELNNDDGKAKTEKPKQPVHVHTGPPIIVRNMDMEAQFKMAVNSQPTSTPTSEQISIMRKRGNGINAMSEEDQKRAFSVKAPYSPTPDQ